MTSTTTEAPSAAFWDKVIGPDKLTEIEKDTATAWLATGKIKITEWSAENIYYVRISDGARFFCKWGI